MRHYTSLFAVILLVLTSNVRATVLINHQGRLTDNSGELVTDGAYPMTFTIYDDPIAGAALWSSGVQSVDVTGGLFSYLLGENVSLPHQVFATNNSLWLGVQLDLDPEMSPRTRLVSAPKAAVAASVSGDIRTSRGKMLLYDNSTGEIIDSGIVIESSANALDHHGHVTILKISNGGFDTTTMVGLFGDPDFASLVLAGDDAPGGGIELESKVDAVDHHGHVTILKISNNGFDTTSMVGLFGDPDFATLTLGDGDSPDSGIVVETKANALDHNGHVTILKISNNGFDTTSMVGLFGDPDFATLTLGDGDSPDSGIVVETKANALDHNGHVTILKISNSGFDTTSMVGLFGDPDFATLTLGDGDSPDSGIVVETKANALDHNGHVTILKISNSGLDTTSMVGLFGDPDFATLTLGDGDSPDSGIVVETKANALDHNGHVTILKISNSGLDTTSMVGLFGDPDFARVVVGNGNSRDSGVVIESKTSSVDHHGHVTILKVANGGIDTTQFVDIRGDVNKSSIQLSGGSGVGGFGGSIYLTADTGSLGGKIGVNTLAPAYELDVVGTICASGGMCSQSDRRLKKNIEPLQGAMLMIESLKPVRYDWRTDEFPDRQFSSENQIGFIAQDVKEILPELVSQGGDGMYSIDYARLTPALVGAIKTQQKQLDAQQKQIEELKNLLKTLVLAARPEMQLTSANK